MIHDHNIATCETCKSLDDYIKEQYARYDAEIATLRNLGNEVAANLENMHETMNCIKEWRKASGRSERGGTK